jgi:hypothetical protein
MEKTEHDTHPKVLFEFGDTIVKKSRADGANLIPWPSILLGTLNPDKLRRDRQAILKVEQLTRCPTMRGEKPTYGVHKGRALARFGDAWFAT